MKLTFNLVIAKTSPVAEDSLWITALFQVVIGWKGRNTHMEMEGSWCDFEELDHE